jgi:hypothetical protein
MYFGQLSPGGLSGQLVAISQVNIRYRWQDLNTDTFVQANELDTSSFISKSAAFDPTNPTSFRSPGRMDPDIKNDRTQEFLVGFQHELMRNLGLDVNYIWRKYDQFTWSDRDNWDSNNFQAFTLNATCTNPNATCEPITYYRPTSAQPSPFLRTNQPDRFRNYNGVELSLTKRYSDRWMANASFAYNNAKDYWDSPRAFEDPSNIENTHRAEFAPESGGSGIDNIFNSARWLTKANGLYTLPWWDINLAGNLQFRQGYPFPTGINVTNRTIPGSNAAGGVGDTFIYYEPLGDVRLENVFSTDFRIDKSFTIGTVRFVPSMDIFNVGNINTILARRRTMFSYNVGTGAGSSPANANDISGIVAPRVIRFGVRVVW